MAPPAISIFISRPQAAGYKPLAVSPYADYENELSNNLLCPRYAENDTSSAPPSPASIESFDILDSIAWRRGHTSHGGGVKARSCDVLKKRWKKSRGHIVAIILLLALFLIGCIVGGYLAVRQNAIHTKDTCRVRSGGDRCEDPAWARCIARNGVGYCEGVM
ncbi:hypothetical protein K458DRAFT_381744 [Lentithecium fluviatile CBS 122367]|uniref:Uncharacterized protein n=1 Tax=Lentithecium fluviatile CBS 122367 TaxID=1168545 RepID=A0A6G1JNU5_9PLEO|nr:hypothetical protein K458DRAFT_381744 [Lentithecium fluviatile CBS 122367]